MSYDRLFVLWCNPQEDGLRYVVGELFHGAEGFLFYYVGRERLQDALDRGFRPLTEFPDLKTAEAPYRAPQLFPTFAQRVPSPKRPDYDSIIQSWGVGPERDPMEILALSGGVQLTDQLELSEWRAEEDDLNLPLLFRVAGERFVPPHAAMDKVEPGAAVELVREPQNPKDPSATQVRVQQFGCHIGYVPRQYSGIVARLLDLRRNLEAKTVRRLTLPQDRGRWVVQVKSA